MLGHFFPLFVHCQDSFYVQIFSLINKMPTLHVLPKHPHPPSNTPIDQTEILPAGHLNENKISRLSYFLTFLALFPYVSISTEQNSALA